MRIEGFHLGNSPREFDAGQPLGDVLVLTTTNGTRAVLQAQAEAAMVLVGALANLSATAAHAARLTRGGAGAWPCAAPACAARSRSTTPTPRAGSSMRSPRTCRSGRSATLPSSRAPAPPPIRRPTARSRLAERARPVRADLTDDVRVCAQVDAVDIVALAEPLDGGRARITALA